MSKKRFFIRHGEATGNRILRQSMAGDHSGYTARFMLESSEDWHLTKTGVEQSVRLHQLFMYLGLVSVNEGCSRPTLPVYASQIVRTQTTSIHACGVDPTIIPLLNERDYKGLEKLPWPKWIEVARRENVCHFDSHPDWSLAGCETTRDVLSRVVAFQQLDLHGLFFTHGDWIMTTRMHMLGIEEGAYHRFRNKTSGNHVRNCQVFTFDGEPGQATETSYLYEGGEWWIGGFCKNSAEFKRERLDIT